MKTNAVNKSKVEAFLKAYRESGRVTKAAKLAHVSRNLHYKRLKKDPLYRDAFEACEDEVVGILVDTAFERATTGRKKPVWYQGRRVGFDSEISDAVLMFLLRARRPDIYGDKKTHEHTGTVELIIQRLAAGRDRLAKHASDGN